ncbi:MAG: SHIRT domain-containing protein, partial [Bifidobacteriaceae bacterium]|nr:SHIRT domain-containing protein [Bifidobacteriaceae bacterium]
TDSVSKGFLSKVIKDDNPTANTALLQAAAAGKITYTEGMTYNEFYIANKYSPEDLTLAPYSITDSNGVAVVNDSRQGQVTTTGLKHDVVNITTDPWRLATNTMYSRLTVGSLNNVDGSTGLQQFGYYGTGTYFPNMIGYGESNTVNDFMLTKDNNFVIPTRYNTKRNDVWLTMRSSHDYGLAGANAYLSVVDSSGNEITATDDEYIKTTTSLHITPAGSNGLGFWGKLGVSAGISSANSSLSDVPVNDFRTRLNESLRSIENASGSRNIPQGVGGQIQLTGFYRNSSIDNTYTADESSRVTDSVKDYDVTYFMYTKGYTNRSAVPESATIPENLREKLGLASTDFAMLYSPNISEFSIQSTRPYFKDFGDTSTAIQYVPGASDFNSLLGLDSFKVADDGVNADGSAVGVDTSRVRVRIDDSATAYTLDELKAELSKSSYAGKSVKLTYVYAGTDANDDIIGKLPSEIDDNSGAYAVPIQRTVTISSAVISERSSYYSRLENGALTDFEDSEVTATNNWDGVATSATLQGGKDKSDYYLYSVSKTVSDVDGSNAVTTDIPLDEIPSTADYETNKQITFNYNYVKKPVVNYRFVSGTAGKDLPSEVTDLIPDSVVTTYGTTVNAQNPSKTEVPVSGGTWVFKGYDSTSLVATSATSTFVGTWEYEEDKPVTPVEPEEPVTPVNPEKPTTGDKTTTTEKQENEKRVIKIIRVKKKLAQTGSSVVIPAVLMLVSIAVASVMLLKKYKK